MRAAEIKVIAATPFASTLKELSARFERDTGHRLVTRFVSGPVVKREIDGGEVFDVALTITPVIDALIAEGKLVAATRRDIAHVGVGVGVRAGAPKPDISTVDAFRQALLNAGSVAHSAEGASGAYFKRLLERLGIADAMKPKLKPLAGEKFLKSVSSGEAEMMVSTISIVMASAELVGPVPAEFQEFIRFAAGVGASARDAGAAKAFIEFLATPAAAAALKANGMEAGVPR